MQYKWTKPEVKPGFGKTERVKAVAFLDHILHKLLFETILKVMNEL